MQWIDFLAMFSAGKDINKKMFLLISTFKICICRVLVKDVTQRYAQMKS